MFHVSCAADVCLSVNCMCRISTHIVTVFFSVSQDSLRPFRGTLFSVCHSLPPLNQLYSLLRELRSLETVTKFTSRRVLSVFDSFGSACGMYVYLCGTFLGSCVKFGRLIAFQCKGSNRYITIVRRREGTTVLFWELVGFLSLFR